MTRNLPSHRNNGKTLRRKLINCETHYSLSLTILTITILSHTAERYNNQPLPALRSPYTPHHKALQSVTRHHKPLHAIISRYTPSQAVTRHHKPLHAITSRYTALLGVTSPYTPSLGNTRRYTPSQGITSPYTPSVGVTRRYTPSLAVTSRYIHLKFQLQLQLKGPCCNLSTIKAFVTVKKCLLGSFLR